MTAASLLLAETTTRTSFELTRLQALTERWHYLVLGLVCAGIVASAVWMVRRDSVELRPWVAALLLVLRVSALGGLLAFFLHLEKRTERKVVHNSRVLMLVDTSLSMGLHDTTASAVPATPNRLEQVVSVLDQGELLRKLRENHDLALDRFDADLVRVSAFPKLVVPAGDATANKGTQTDDKSTDPQKADGEKAVADAKPVVEWNTALLPQGSETRLGQALRQLINDERSTPVAGVVVFSDGGQNAGIDPSAAISHGAAMPKFRSYTVGIGSDRRPANVRVSDLVAPARAYPGDSFNITGYLQSEGLADRTVAVELLSRSAGEAGKIEEGKIEGSQRVTLGGRGEVVPVKFDITPGEKGRRMYRFRVKAPPEDSNASDDQQEVDIEIVDRKTKILLIASGPTREYIFLRNQLQRDKETVVDVWLQSASEGISQDAHQILTALPATPQEMFEYDCIVAFDPDWKALDASEVDLLERWVAEKAGGLIVVAGPVEMDRWVQDPKLAKIRALYPVEFNRRLSLMEEGRFGSTTPWPIEFTSRRFGSRVPVAGRQRPAQPADLEQLSRRVRLLRRARGQAGRHGLRPLFRSRVGQPATDRPVYMAGQFYGAGRVFYMGSGEMWRLRALDDTYFEQFYTKLIRHVSQGRLLLGSSRGMLLVDRDRYLLGNTVVVRAQLSNAQFEPLDAASATLANRAARQHQRGSATGRRSGSQGYVRGPVHGLAGRNVSLGNGDARERQRTTLAAHSGQGARPGTRESRTQRHAAERDRQADRRNLLRRRRRRAGLARPAAAGESTARSHRGNVSGRGHRPDLRAAMDARAVDHDLRHVVPGVADPEIVEARLTR